MINQARTLASSSSSTLNSTVTITINVSTVVASVVLSTGVTCTRSGSRRHGRWHGGRMFLKCPVFRAKNACPPAVAADRPAFCFLSSRRYSTCGNTILKQYYGTMPEARTVLASATPAQWMLSSQRIPFEPEEWVITYKSPPSCIIYERRAFKTMHEGFPSSRICMGENTLSIDSVRLVDEIDTSRMLQQLKSGRLCAIEREDATGRVPPYAY